MWHAVIWRKCEQRNAGDFILKSLTTNLPISPSVFQHRTTKATVLGEYGNTITNALGPLVSISTVAVVRDAIFHQNVLVEHFEAICHFWIFQQIGAHKVCLLFDRRFTGSWCNRLRARNALVLVLIHVQRTPWINKCRSHLISGALSENPNQTFFSRTRRSYSLYDKCRPSTWNHCSLFRPWCRTDQLFYSKCSPLHQFERISNVGENYSGTRTKEISYV